MFITLQGMHLVRRVMPACYTPRIQIEEGMEVLNSTVHFTLELNFLHLQTKYTIPADEQHLNIAGERFTWKFSLRPSTHILATRAAYMALL